jgi:membrane protease YdiL (CAAX protease family)
MIKFHTKKIPEAFVVVIGIVLFGLLIHKDSPGRSIAFIILFLTSILIIYISRNEDPLISFGITRIQKKKIFYLMISLMLGFGLGVITRHAFNLSPLPGQLSWVALLVPFIGITEELIFRGFIQGHVRPSGRLFAMLFATTGHTLYKVAVIASLPEPAQFNIQFLVIWTFIGSLVFSLLKELSGSVIPSAIAHGSFDIILYGGFTMVPFWVWS